MATDHGECEYGAFERPLFVLSTHPKDSEVTIRQEQDGTKIFRALPYAPVFVAEGEDVVVIQNGCTRLDQYDFIEMIEINRRMRTNA